MAGPIAGGHWILPIHCSKRDYRGFLQASATLLKYTRAARGIQNDLFCAWIRIYPRLMAWTVVASLALALWFGGGVVAGLIAPPAAFQFAADRQIAGSIAGAILNRFALLALVSGAVYCASWAGMHFMNRAPSRIALILILLALAVVCYSQSVLSPEVAELRDAIRSGGETPELSGRFGALHGRSVALFGVQLLLTGVALVLHIQRSVAGRT